MPLIASFVFGPERRTHQPCEREMRWVMRLAPPRVDWVVVAVSLLVLAVALVLTMPLWQPDVLGHFRH